MAELGAQEAMAVQEAQEAMAVQGVQEAMAGGPCGRGLGPLGPAPTAGTLLPPPPPPPKINTQEQDRTGQPSGAKQTGTGQDSPQEQEALLGWLGS